MILLHLKLINNPQNHLKILNNIKKHFNKIKHVFKLLFNIVVLLMLLKILSKCKWTFLKIPNQRKVRKVKNKINFILAISSFFTPTILQLQVITFIEFIIIYFPSLVYSMTRSEPA
eukprot:UN00742